MIIKVETFQGDAYLLTAYGEVWRVKFSGSDGPVMEKLGTVDHERQRRLCDPQLARLFDHA